MGLIDLQTDLTSLKYGDNKPIVRYEMGNKISQASARTSDVKRIAGILTRAPGKKFGFNQVLLQRAKIGDAAIIKSIIKILNNEGIKVISSIFFNPELSLKKGNYTKLKPNKQDLISIKKGKIFF